MQFHRIANLPAFPEPQFPTWVTVPSEGMLPATEGERLVTILRGHTTTPNHCYLGLWEGYGVSKLNAFAGMPRLLLPDRAYYLFRRPIDAVTSLTIGTFRHPPNLWWPEDHAWCVATEIDLGETYVAASAVCVQQVVADAGIEAFEVPLEGRIDIDGDLINL
jgi:hypothetical protein